MKKEESAITQTQQQKDDLAFSLIIELVQLARAGHGYHRTLNELKVALKESERGRDLLNTLYSNLCSHLSQEAILELKKAGSL